MSEEPEPTPDQQKRAAELAEELFNKFSEVINVESAPWMAVDAEAEPERAAIEKHLWGKALMCALAQQLGIIEGALMFGDEIPSEQVKAVREAWIEAGHRMCMEVIEAQRAEEEEN